MCGMLYNMHLNLIYLDIFQNEGDGVSELQNVSTNSTQSGPSPPTSGGMFKHLNVFSGAKLAELVAG